MTSTSLFSSTLILFLGGDIALLLNSAIFLAALTSLPRVFLNLTNSSIKEPMLVQIIHSNSPIVVIGGGGYIGSTLVEKLLKNNSKVRVLDKFTYGKGVFDDLKKNNRLEIIKGDATDLSSLTLALRDAKAVVHLAGIVGDPASMVDDKLTRHMNIISTRMIKETVKGFRIPKFIFASSCSVYGASNNSLNERSRLNPLSPYAKSKIDSEKEILQDTFDEFHPTILRFATVFGHSRKPRFDLVLNLFAALAYNNEAIKVNGGNQWRPFIHATDAAQAIIKVIDAPTNKISRKIFNAGDDSLNITIMEAAKIVQSVFKKNGKNVKIIVRKGDADLRNCIVSFQKIKEQLGFFCQISIEEGISEIAKHFKKRTYKKPYTDSYYSALETTKEIKKEFYSKSYRKTHFSDFAF
jgi:nucleoside-diphosphate-sugar epimerase